MKTNRITRLLVVGSYDSPEARVRGNLLASHPRLSSIKVFTTFLFDSEEDQENWIEKLAPEHHPRTNARQIMKSDNDRRVLRRKFFDKVMSAIQAHNPDAIIVHVGMAFRWFHGSIRGAFSMIKSRYPSLRIGLDTPRHRIENAGLDGALC